MTEDTDDEEELALYNRQLYTVKHDLEANPGKTERLRVECQWRKPKTVRWEASRCLTTRLLFAHGYLQSRTSQHRGLHPVWILILHLHH